MKTILAKFIASNQLCFTSRASPHRAHPFSTRPSSHGSGSGVLRLVLEALAPSLFFMRAAPARDDCVFRAVGASKAICRFPASRRPLETQLGSPKSRAFGSLWLELCPEPSCEPHRRLAGHSPDTRRSTSDRGSEVLPRVSGEAPGRVRRGVRGIGGQKLSGLGRQMIHK